MFALVAEKVLEIFPVNFKPEEVTQEEQEASFKEVNLKEIVIGQIRDAVKDEEFKFEDEVKNIIQSLDKLDTDKEPAEVREAFFELLRDEDLFESGHLKTLQKTLRGLIPLMLNKDQQETFISDLKDLKKKTAMLKALSADEEKVVYGVVATLDAKETREQILTLIDQVDPEASNEFQSKFQKDLMGTLTRTLSGSTDDKVEAKKPSPAKTKASTAKEADEAKTESEAK